MQFKTKHFNHTVTLPLKLIHEANSNGWLDSLAYFVWFKKKNIIYNYTARSAARIFNIHRNTLITHIAVLEDQGLLIRRNGHICTIGTQKMYEKYGKPLVKVKYTTASKSIQLHYIKFFILKHNLKTQGHVNGRKSRIIQFQGGKLPLKSKKPLDLGRTVNRYTISNKRLGELYERSQYTGIRIQKKFRELSLIKTSSKYKLVKSQVSQLEFEMNYKGSGYIRQHGNLYRRDTNTIHLVGKAKSAKRQAWEIGISALKLCKNRLDLVRSKYGITCLYSEMKDDMDRRGIKFETSTIA